MKNEKKVGTCLGGLLDLGVALERRNVRLRDESLAGCNKEGRRQRQISSVVESASEQLMFAYMSAGRRPEGRPRCPPTQSGPVVCVCGPKRVRFGLFHREWGEGGGRALAAPTAVLQTASDTRVVWE